MKQIIIILYITLVITTLLFIAIGAFTQNTIIYKDNIDCKCDYIKKRYYRSGQLKWEIPYVNGKKQGIEKLYYESGELNRETPYKVDKLNGITKWYYKSGKLAGAANYRHGVLKGYKECTDGRRGSESLDCLNYSS